MASPAACGGAGTKDRKDGYVTGTTAFDLRLAGLAFLEHSDAEPSELRPPRFSERPWFLTDYPGRVSWAELRQSSEVVLGSPN